MRLSSAAVAAAILVSAPAHGEPSAALEARVAMLESQLALRDADAAVALAERDLADAELRYSAARTGQARKGRGNPLSIGNPGSRRRWDEAVAAAEAQVAAARARKDEALAERAELVANLCREGRLATGCAPAP